MEPSLERPSISAGGLVTVAFLKAQLDSGSTHLDIFLPLVLDAARSFQHVSFAKQEIQERLSNLHGVAMPQHVIATLLNRAIRNGLVARDVGRYKTTPAIENITPILNQTSEINESLIRLGEKLREHAATRNFNIATPEDALDVLLRFLETEQVDLLLGGVSGTKHVVDTSLRERIITAEFIHDIVRGDEAYSSVLSRLLEGLVLYHAAFLPDLSTAARKFKNLRVAFDSSLVRQAIGLEGEAAQMLITETINLLKKADVQCLVFEKSIDEIRRILSFYQSRLGTTSGQNSIRPSAMSRYVLTRRFTPSDMNEFSALLTRKIQDVGLSIMPMPQRRAITTAGEKLLIERLASTDAHQDEVEARVQHDVDCIAAVLTLRSGHQSITLEDSKAIFAADQPLVIHNVIRWWLEDEKESGLEPIANIRALANLAWLKKPALSVEFKMRELVSVCSAALRPNRETWKRFLKHLENLRASQTLTEDEMTAIIISATSDKLLVEAQATGGEDIDSVTLDEIVERVRQEYAADAELAKEALIEEHKQQILKIATERDLALAAEKRSVAYMEKRKQIAKLRADSCAGAIGQSLMWAINLILAGAIWAILRVHFAGERINGVVAWTSVSVIAIFYILEATILRQHLRQCVRKFEGKVSKTVFRWLDPQVKHDDSL